MSSARFEQLLAHLKILGAHLLPDEFADTGIYNDQERVDTLALAYRVLSHAEIESYFEDRALKTADSARVAWETTGHVSRVALCLLAFSGKEMALPPPTLEAPNENKRKMWSALVDIGEKLNPTISLFNCRVRSENHGIKEKNLLSLLLPIGVDHLSLDPTFLADINSFGSLRGLAAHSSRQIAVKQAVDPAEEFRRVESLLPGIMAIDTLIDRVIGEIQNAQTTAP